MTGDFIIEKHALVSFSRSDVNNKAFKHVHKAYKQFEQWEYFQILIHFKIKYANMNTLTDGRYVYGKWHICPQLLAKAAAHIHAHMHARMVSAASGIQFSLKDTWEQTINELEIKPELSNYWRRSDHDHRHLVSGLLSFFH